MLSKQYYERFAGYEYMLIYQLDAYVFSDQLVQWCDQRYDYIGAPWLDAQDTGENPAFQQPFSVGNGGFSLRRVQTFQSYCDYRIHLIFLAHFLSSIFDIIVKKTKQNPFYVLLRLCTWLPVKTFSKLFFPSEADKNNEDVIWAKRLAVVGIIPANNIAAQFSFEDYPEYMFQLHNGLLPFGCHHWNIYYHYQFWKSFIPLC
ncbi:hypothetical protein AGMMS49940_06730 [Spirochaetia bacterium]|nr:hypothetical protein AGMMS49940_06730 [Spirochaetia bacterium]